MKELRKPEKKKLVETPVLATLEKAQEIHDLNNIFICRNVTIDACTEYYEAKLKEKDERIEDLYYANKAILERLHEKEEGYEFEVEQNAKLEQELSALKDAYHELIMAVGNKYKDETRHETALKYIKRAEQDNDTTEDKTILGQEG